MRTYIVKTEDGFLYWVDGKAAFTDDESHAGLFPTEEEAHVAAQMFGYVEGEYRVMPAAISNPA